jgi:CheY-like chemotaxis protein
VLRRHRCVSPPCPVLVVEDDADQRQLVCKLLEREGWEVFTAENGVDALQQLQLKAVELIILDLLMPEMDGFEFVAVLKQNSEWNNIPVIVLTSRDLTEADRARLNGRVQRVISKGAVSGDSLIAEIRRAVLQSAANAGEGTRNGVGSV